MFNILDVAVHYGSTIEGSELYGFLFLQDFHVLLFLYIYSRSYSGLSGCGSFKEIELS
jgi:hypothetical protein